MKTEFIRLFDRDITRLYQEIEAYPTEESLWTVVDGISNSAGNLSLHLVGNLNEYIGRILGHESYQRNRPLEFSAKGVAQNTLLEHISETKAVVIRVLEALDENAFNQPYPDNVLGYPMSTLYFLIHLQGHLNYHLGQIDYHRRILARQSGICFVR